MRTVLIATAGAALVAAGGASAQRMVQPGPGVGYSPPGMAQPIHVGAPMGYPGTVGQPMRGYTGGSRWGSKVDGHWWAGMNAPGGWRGYHRPYRGWALPGYWNQSQFTVTDWSTYGLGQPPAGYSWTRYYDDAVLIDDRGRVYDCVDGVDWDRYGAGYGGDAAYRGGAYEGGDVVYAGPGDRAYPPPPPAYAVQPPYGATAGYPQGGYAGAGYAQPGPAYVERRNSGVGGALVGAAVGGVAGNLIGGRGNRLAGTLIGAGVGGVAGYAIDRSGSHRAPVAPGPYGGGYAPAPGYAPGGYAPGAGYAPPPPAPGGVWQSPDGGTMVSTTSVGGYYGGSTTVVTVQTAPVVTTTTTEIGEDHVTWSRRRPVHHKWVRKAACGCR